MIGNTYLKLQLLKRNILFNALYPYKCTRKVKDFQKLSNKEIYFNFQSNSTNKPFRFISWPNFLEGHHFLNQENIDGYIISVWHKLVHFSLPLNLATHRMGKAAKILCPSPDVENKKSLNSILYFIASSPKLL